jgi:cell division protein FtsW
MDLKKVDKPLLISIFILVAIGILIFWSASLGLVARDPARYSAALSKQILFGLFPGVLIAYGISKIKSEFWRHQSAIIFAFAVVINILVFIPGIGITHGGATRWLDLGFTSFQPSEILKIFAVIAYAGWLSAVKNKISEKKYGLFPLLIIIGISSLILFFQPDNDTLMVLGATLVLMHLVARAPLKDFLILGSIAILGIGLIVTTRPYIKERVIVLFSSNNEDSSLTSGYQINQSLIALGSGGITGRGFGKGIQKYGFLPEPVGDSIFAVAGEEFGFLGTLTIVSAYVFFAIRAYIVAEKITSRFSAFTIIGLSTGILIQSFINIAGMSEIIPISGIPLVFASQGGSSLLISLLAVGIILGLSREAVKK